jgi:hypothetical protein
MDFGDAPDGSDASYPVATTAAFPTLSASDGARHTTLGQEWLGKAGSAPDSESEANVVNLDLYDDAFPPIPFFLTLTSLPPAATVSFWVTVDAGAPVGPRIINMLIDWDQSGDWKNVAGAAPEWAIQNYALAIAPGTTQLVTVPITWGLGAQLSPQIFWVRVTLTRSPIDPAPFGADGWDGSGSFAFGETEDFLFHPNRKHDSSDPWSPPVNPPTGWTPPPGGGGILPAIDLVPKDQDVTHGTPATVTVNLVNGPAPTDLEWAVGFGQRGGFPFEPGSGPLSFGGSWTSPGSGSSATSAAGAAPAIGTITINSTVDSQLSPEEWPLRVRARWPGVRSQTRKAVVRIWHSGWSGAFGIYSHFRIVEKELESVADDGDRAALLDKLGISEFWWKTGDYFVAKLTLDEVLLDLANLSPAPPSGLLNSLVSDISTAIDPFGLAYPVPEMASPVDGDTLTGTIQLVAETTSESPAVTTARFYVATTAGNVWTLVGTDSDGLDGWSTSMDTTAWPDGPVRLRAEMENTLGETGEFDALVWIDNSVAAPTVVEPLAGADVCGIITVEAACVTDESVTGLLEIQGASGDWFEIGSTNDVEDSFATVLDTGRLEAGVHMLRATVTDDVGNSNSVSWPINVQPSFVAWKYLYGILELDAEEDVNLDGLPLAIEYYLGFSPFETDARTRDFTYTATEDPPQFSFKPAEFLDGVRAKVEISGNLSDWIDLVIDPVPDVEGNVIVDVPLLPDDPPRSFVRLNVWEERP